MARGPLMILCLAAILAAGFSRVGAAGDVELGQYLAGECLGCHMADGSDHGIPSIIRLSEADFVMALNAYRDGLRAHRVMQMIAGRLSESEIAALAAYFGGLE
ncbi:MAG: hypothetical protein H5U16_03725 [Roseovarius sp.]|nr:hypothetical protein [Roseovarius sp.]